MAKPGAGSEVGLEPEYGDFCRIQSEVGVRILLICWSRSLVSNFKFETKNDTSMKCNFDVTALVSQTLKSSESEYDIRKIFGVRLELELNFLE